MYIITFYSFKGGVGRTFALVNVGAELARRGRRVLLVDFDLEAPGLETFELLRPPQPHPGVVEYVAEYLRTKQIPDMRQFMYPAATIDKNNGQLWVMPAGRRDINYQASLVKIDWKRLYRDGNGFEFFEETKKQWEQAFKPDYVLIDSRTGHTDVEGICTRQLPDAVVVLFFPNEQNLVGLRDVCRRIRSEKERRELKEPIRLHFVMSNVPDLDDEDGILHHRQEAFRTELGMQQPATVIHRYESVMLFNQAIFVLDRPSSRLSREYQQLTEELITANPADREGAMRFLHQYAQGYLPKVARDISSEVRRKLGVMEGELPARPMIDFAFPARKREKDQLEKVIRGFADDSDILHRGAQCRILEGNDQEARDLLNEALVLQPNLAAALFDRAMCNKNLGKTSDALVDLRDYLRNAALPSPEILRALRELYAIAPARIAEAFDLPAIKALDDDAMLEVYYLMRLWKTPDGFARAIQSLRNRLAKDGFSVIRDEIFELAEPLIADRQWQDAISLLEARPLDDLRALEVFDLAMAYWGETGHLPEQLCRLALERLEGEDGALDKSCYYDSYITCWLLWGIGKVSEALYMLDQAVVVFEQKPGPADSYWRFRRVPRDQFIDDCRQLRRMIEGEPISPAFLVKPSSAHASDTVPNR